MSITSASTLAAVKAQYEDNADYAESGSGGSTGKAKLFIQACRVLLLRLPQSIGEGNRNVAHNGTIFQRQLDAAVDWLASNDTSRGQVIHASFEECRP